jgi:hypothetical protein
MRDFYQWEQTAFENNHTFNRLLDRAAERFFLCWRFYLGPLLTLPVLAVLPVIHKRKMLLPFLICATLAAGLLVETWTLPHYFSPATGAIYLLVVQGLRQLWHGPARGRLAGPALVRAIPVLACAMIFLRLAAAAFHIPVESAWPKGDLRRAMIADQLQHSPGRQLVIVVYDPAHNPDHEWVYNDADIDAAKVVWARDLGAGANQELLTYFKDRHVWQVNGDASLPRLEPYEASPK